MKNTVFLYTVLATCCICGLADGKVWYVHPDSALNRIQAGLDSCSTGDTVLVGPGTYHENIWWPRVIQSVKLISERGPATTIIDGDSLDIVLRIIVTVDSTTMIRGFTIMHGYNDFLAGGITLIGASPTVTGNVLTANRGANGGGMFCMDGSGAIITGNTFTRNNASTVNGGWGGGILIYQSSPRVTGNTIISNRAYWFGGGIFCQEGSPVITSNRIDSNSVLTSNLTGGGGVSLYSDTSVFRHNSVKHNYARYGGGIRLDWFSCATIDSNTIENNRLCGIFCGDSVAQPVIRYNSIINNAWEALVNIDSSVTINAENNWWGDSTGPYHASNPGGRGDTVSDYVDFIPWSRWPIVRMEEENDARCGMHDVRLNVYPNPFANFAVVPGHEKESFTLFDVSGRRSGVFRGDRIGVGLAAGVYFVKAESGLSTPRRIVKIR